MTTETETDVYVDGGAYVDGTWKVVPEGVRVTRCSANIGKLVGALAKAQLEYESAKKDTKNPYYNSKYADISSIFGATQQALAKQGLVVIQHATTDVQRQTVTTVSLLAHESDQWIEASIELPAIMLSKDGKPRFDAQSCGSAQTYGRRYQYQNLVGVAAEPDDDGNRATGSREEAQDVAKRKIAELEAKKAEKASQQAPALVSSLFYTLPEKHNGNYAEFINLKEYTFHHAERGDALRLLFSTVMSKQFARTGTVLVPVDRLDTLLATLAGDMAIDVKKLEAQ